MVEVLTLFRDPQTGAWAKALPKSSQGWEAHKLVPYDVYERLMAENLKNSRLLPELQTAKLRVSDIADENFELKEKQIRILEAGNRYIVKNKELAKANSEHLERTSILTDELRRIAFNLICTKPEKDCGSRPTMFKCGSCKTKESIMTSLAQAEAVGKEPVPKSGAFEQVTRYHPEEG